MKTRSVKLLFTLLICVAILIPIYPRLSEWVEWKQQQSFARTITAWCTHRNRTNDDWEQFCIFKDFCATSCYDKISDKDKHLFTAATLANKICNSPTAKENILEQGLLENTFDLYHQAQTAMPKESDYNKFISWIFEQNQKMAATGEKAYLFLDHDYMTQLDNIERRVYHALTPPSMSEEESKVIFMLNAKEKNAFFTNNSIPTSSGDGMSSKTPLNLSHTGNECITVLLRYIHDVLKATSIRILYTDEKSDNLYKIILYDKSSKKSFSLYVLTENNILDKYTVL